MDLNLVRTFVHIYETGSLTLTARVLFVTQPSVSHSLSRLREEFNDELFLRQGRRMVPTRLATELYGVFQNALGRIDHAVAGVKAFDPAVSSHRFRISLSDLGEAEFLPRILQRLSAEAPGVRLEVVPMEIESLADWLTSGRIDAAIASSPLPGDFDSTLLRTEKYLCLMREDRLRPGEELTLEKFVAARQVTVDRATGHQLPQIAMERLGIPVDASVVIQHFSALPRLVTECDLIGIAPATMARDWARRWPLRLVELPFPVPGLRVMLHRRLTDRHSPSLRWFHAAVDEALAG